MQSRPPRARGFLVITHAMSATGDSGGQIRLHAHRFFSDSCHDWIFFFKKTNNKFKIIRCVLYKCIFFYLARRTGTAAEVLYFKGPYFILAISVLGNNNQRAKMIFVMLK